MVVKERPRVVIVGAGFGGLAVARELAGAPVEVTIVDRNNYHTFLPLLYQVAAAELEATEIGYPVRTILRKLPGYRFTMAEVVGLDLDKKVVETEDRPLPYDFLVLAMGSIAHTFGVEGAEQHTFPLYSLEQGVALRSHILRCFERAMREPDEAKRRQMLTFTIVGGGPTGVEFGGALAELIHGPLVKDYRGLDLREVRVVLLEAMDTVLSLLPKKLQAYTLSRLGRMGVDVRLGAMVTRITPEAVHLKGGSVLPTETVVWTAGVRADPEVGTWGLPTGRSGRVTVLSTLQVSEYLDVSVVGDLAYLEQDGRPLPMVAPVAVQQGKVAGQNIIRQISGQELLTFRYRDPGAMVTIGRNAGVARLWGKAFAGFIAWFLWLGAHLIMLIGFRNRFFVLLKWAWDYFSFERAARLIMPRQPLPQPEQGGHSASHA
jgi:NADH dehydrogenase